MGAFSRSEARIGRKNRVRKKVRGTSGRPRLCIFKSLKHIYAQIIDDETEKTLVEASSLSKDLRARVLNKGGSREGAAMIGSVIAERAIGKGIKRVVFDRNGFLYHGRVKALSDAAREGGLEF